jgi:hypothetical protein
MREGRGVYYTPEPVVSYINRSVDYTLRNHFPLVDGLTDSSKIALIAPKTNDTKSIRRVLILDCETETGTFLFDLINRVYTTFRRNRRMWSGYSVA